MGLAFSWATFLMTVSMVLRFPACASREDILFEGAEVKMTRTRRISRMVLRISALLLCVVLVAFGFAYQDARNLLSKDSGPVQADAIIVLGGGWNERAERAVELYRERAAPLVIVTGCDDCESNRVVLTEGGVPNEAIELECNSTSTRENALFTLPILKQKGVHNVIIVTSWYHSRRALACFRHYAPELNFYSRPSFYGADRSEWKRKSVSRYIRKEFVKLAGYWVVYGVRPW
jgi:uncharacterized SAM-binding protein YcdF (DUF218 family)